MSEPITNKQQLLAYYHDSEATNKVKQDLRGNYKVDFGKVENPPVAGQDSIYTSIYVRNEHHYPMELKPVTVDKDLTISEWPEFLEPGESGKVTLKFSPSADRIKPLEGGSWDFTLIVYAHVGPPS